MTRRRTLVVIVQSFALVACAVFAIPFIGVLFGPPPDAARQRAFVDTADLPVGEPRIIELSSNRAIIVLRASPQQLHDLARLTAHVWEPEHASPDSGVFVHWAFSTGKFGGCRLRHEPPAYPHDATAVNEPRWLGGYWAPGCEASYDYAGRAIKTTAHAFGSYVAKSKPLRAPEFTLLDDGRLAITIE